MPLRGGAASAQMGDAMLQLKIRNDDAFAVLKDHCVTPVMIAHEAARKGASDCGTLYVLCVGIVGAVAAEAFAFVSATLH